MDEQKVCKRVAPEGHICGQNSKIWQFWGLYSPISAPINKRDVLARHRALNYKFIGATCGPCEAKNPFLDHWGNATTASCATACKPAGSDTKFWHAVPSIFLQTPEGHAPEDQTFQQIDNMVWKYQPQRQLWGTGAHAPEAWACMCTCLAVSISNGQW